MKKNDIFTFTAPNGVEVTGVALYKISISHRWICYAQNRLCIVFEPSKGNPSYCESFVDYAILPDYDDLLARYNDIEAAQAETQSEI